MIFLPRVKYFGIKIVPRSDLRARTAPGRTTSKKISFNIGTWNVRTLERAGKLKNLASEMDKCELNVVGLSEVRWPGNYTMFHSGKVKAEKGVVVVLRNDIVKRLTKVEYLCNSW